MMKKHSLISFLLVFCLCFIMVLPAFAADMVEEEYTIDEPYEYPIIPGTPEWLELENQIEKVNACQIPEEILSKMTTEALFETVLNYPLRSNMYVYNDIFTGYNAVKEQFNGLQELAKRDDLQEVMTDYHAVSLYSTEEDDGTLKQCFGRLLYRIFTEDTSLQVSSHSGSTTVYTPAGTAVGVVTNQTYADLGITEADAIKVDEEIPKVYPNAKKIGTYSSMYNCYSYAFISTSPSNNKWLNYIKHYLTDGSYKHVDSPAPGDILVYGMPDPTNGLGVHAAIIKTIYLTDPSWVRAKWSWAGVWESYYFDCPYYQGANCAIDVYRLAK